MMSEQNINNVSSLEIDNKLTNIHHLLKKIYNLEKGKTRYLSHCDFSSYKKACVLQEKITLQMKSPDYQKVLDSQKNFKNHKLAQDIRKQVETNQILLDDIKRISQSYLEPLNSKYYDQGGKIKKTAKVFTTDI